MLRLVWRPLRNGKSHLASDIRDAPPEVQRIGQHHAGLRQFHVCFIKEPGCGLPFREPWLLCILWRGFKSAAECPSQIGSA